jgi:hypothetical protein
MLDGPGWAGGGAVNALGIGGDGRPVVGLLEHVQRVSDSMSAKPEEAEQAGWCGLGRDNSVRR